MRPSDDSTRVLLVRHGRTTANAAGLLSGRHDAALDARGASEVAAVARAVAEQVHPAELTVVSSPLRRALDTAAAIAGACGLDATVPHGPGEREADRGSTRVDRLEGSPVLVDPRFIELDYGRWDGRPLADVPASAWGRWRGDPDFSPPGGETLESVSRRVSEALSDWTDRVAGQTLVVASHVSPIKAAVAWSLGVDDSVTWRMRLSNASICELLVSPPSEGRRTRMLVRFNETAHLR